jgi:hypothetical protein
VHYRVVLVRHLPQRPITTFSKLVCARSIEGLLIKHRQREFTPDLLPTSELTIGENVNCPPRRSGIESHEKWDYVPDEFSRAIRRARENDFLKSARPASIASQTHSLIF